MQLVAPNAARNHYRLRRACATLLVSGQRVCGVCSPAVSDPKATTMSHVLVIDNDDAIRETLRLALEDEGYAVSTTCCPADAMELLLTSADRMVVLFDAGVPRVSDGQVSALASLEDPLLRRHAYICMTTSAVLMHPDLHGALSTLAVPIIEKPFDADTLVAAVREAQEHLSLAPGRP